MGLPIALLVATLFYDALQKAFAQAVQRYNQAHPSAEITVEKSFFERPISTKVLLGLLAASTPLVAWGSRHNAKAAVCFLVGWGCWLAEACG